MPVVKANITTLGRLLRRPWYSAWSLIDRLLYEGHDYTIHVPFGQRVFTPWFNETSESEFAGVMMKVRAAGRVTVSPDRCYVLHHLCRESVRKHPSAAIAECGVYSGSTAHVLAETVMSSRIPLPPSLHLFDTFTGMPETSCPARDYHRPGDFSDTSLDACIQRLKPYDQCVFHPGFMPDTFAELESETTFSFVHVDVDIYLSIKACCEWFWPRMCPGGVIVFDDYGFYPYRHAARKAVDEYFAQQPESPWPLPTGQAVAFKEGT